MAHFYGWTDKQIGEMPVSKFNEYLACINVIASEDALLDINIASFPHSKKEYQRKLQRQLKKTFSEVVERRPQPLADFKDMVANVAGKLYGGRKN